MTQASSSPYAIGQLWRCRGRHAEEMPLLLINRIDTHPLGGQILHTTVREVRIRRAGGEDNILRTLPHVPLIAQTLERSEAVLIGNDEVDETYLPGYLQWKTAFAAGQAGSYGIAVAEILDIVERHLAQRAS
ncbi:hypothetical protein [Xanthomonas vesicatoria]|uniref:Uncharacterized protein n=1 Tax=Xanthomonas vesicatoria TaxID=56460 RepID=A0AAJ0N406_9XANT|nr:hypothetical protein [Xanthomonas vesicatoria]APO96860.1 hypothetical protein BI313_21805 [Xanthomonas vesicatoria]KHM92810.1 hypothetical protein OR61_15830 [Xanthomonas vesicatoria]KHM97510.1 hypothetical protein OR60_02745 [Xanthomonas vesicatoria]KTF35225.1 hypothetical protein LMG919_13820 [Xanthomonas vesicatoria]MCC8558677.1 hypothetical protein [Xanthomonas vesicatoria]